MTHLDDISYLIQNGKLNRLNFGIHNALYSDVEKIEKILDKYTRKRWKHTDEKEDKNKGGFLKRKNIKEIIYSGKDLFHHYCSFVTSKPILKLGKHNCNIRLYIDFPQNKSFEILEEIVTKLKLRLSGKTSEIYDGLKYILKKSS